MDWFTFIFSKHRYLILSFVLCCTPVIVIAGNDNTNLGYRQHNLVSDGSTPADHIDPNLINPWGISFGTTNPVWLANNGSGTSTLYNGLGNPIPLVVTVPPAPSVGGWGSPTGIVFNNTTNWMVSSNNQSGAAAFIFATEDGTISGWSPSVNHTKAIIAVDNSASKAVYKGLAQGANGIAVFLYAANFNSGKVDMFDATFKPIKTPGTFVDPSLPQGYAPFNVQNINGSIYVTYAKQDAAKHDPVKGKGLGIVNVFDPNGNFIHRVATGGNLNAPWGLVITPSNFGRFSNQLLIGNFGDGKINSFDLFSYEFRGTLQDSNGKPLVIDGLWGLSFGNGFNNQATDVLYFTAGPDNETHGIYGNITAI